MRKIWLALIVLFGFYIFLPFGAFAQNDGWFLPYRTYNQFGQSDVKGIAIGDLNNNGRNDVAVITEYYFDPEHDYKLYVFLQDQNGELHYQHIYDTFDAYAYERDLEIGDFNGDGFLDLVTEARDNGIAIFYHNTTDPDEIFDPFVFIPTTYSARTVRSADINGDGNTDIVVISSGGGQNHVEVLFQDDDGNLADVVIYSTSDSCFGFEVGDVGGNNSLDIVIAMDDGSGNNIRVLIQNADGTFTPNSYDAGESPRDIAIGDFDGDTLNDVVVSYGGNEPSSFISVLTQNGGGGFNTAVPYPVHDIPGHIIAGDANRDGFDDVIVLHNGWCTFGLLLQNSGILDSEELYGIPYASWYADLNFGDINNDGYEDVLVTGNNDLIISYGWDQTPGLIVKFPADGSSFNVDSSVSISWGSYGDIDEVDIAYSIDGGSNWHIIANNASNDGFYSWTTPYTPSDNCIVRVTNSAGGLEARSGKFSITDDGVDRVFVNSPNGGESLVADTTYNITWMSTGSVENVKLEYSTDDGSNWTEIIASTPEADGSYTWTVPNEPSNQCLVRISDAANSSTNDTSDDIFTIYEPGTATITVTAPNGGESITGGTTYTITWTYTGNIASVVLSYSIDNGATWTTIGTGPVLNTGSYSWVTPNAYSTQCRVRVRDATNPLVSDQSNNVFSIGSFGNETATVLSPNGGEVFCIGRTAAITWTTTGLVGNMRIQYSTNNGASWKNIVASTVNDGSYLWTVPDDASNQCLVRVSEASDGDPTDTSDSVFSILECGANLSITSPKGGEVWQVGSVHDITWVSGDKVGNYVKLLYSTDNQASWKTITSSTANDGIYSWTIPNTPSDTCNVKIIDTSNTSISNVSFGTFAIVSGSVKPEISLNRTHLYYGAMKSSTAKTPTQVITVNNSGYGTLKWQVSIYDLDEEDSDDLAWVQVSNFSGTESGTVKVDIEPLGMAVGTHTGAIKFTSTDASNSPQIVYITMNVYASQSDANPFGFFDSPVDGSTVKSSIPVTGWALDDIGIDEVTIWRNTMPGEGSGEVYIGDAVMVEGPRPDVEQTFPTYPMSYKGGWGYMLLTNMLPNGGNGTYTLHAYARDLAGRQVKLGSKTITCDNAHAVKPFGAIDTPDQGGEATGTDFRNQGWVLTPLPNKIPIDGSTIKVYVDGQNIGTPIYNIYRLDIATLFPGYANSNGAMGYFDFDTTAYESGIHTIQWVATDNVGNRDGVGSRYFSIQNPGYNSHSTGKTSTTGTSALGKIHYRFADLLKIPLDRAAPIKMSTGYKKDVKPRTITADKKGIIHITVPQDERIVLDLNQTQVQFCTGYLRVKNQLRPLPPGASIDTKAGILYWQPGPASFGKYQLVFISIDNTGKTSRQEFMIKIVPKFAGK